jgi:hypothetical protein
MKSGVDIKGVDRVMASLQAAMLEGSSRVDGEVGYTAPHAVLIHEDLTMPHQNGQAKYLEQPYRQRRRALVTLMLETARRTGSLAQGALAAVRALLAASRPLVPVDTGELRDSGYARVTRR